MISRRLLLLALSLPALAGCVTKRDIRDLRAEMQVSRAAQEGMLRELRDEIRQEIRRQNGLVLDSLSAQDVRLRGDLRNRMVQIERQLIQIQELTGQGQQRLTELRQDLRAQEEALRAAAAAGNAAGGGTGAADAGDPNELFGTAEDALQRGSLSTARAGFEEFVRAFPQHERVPAAQLHIADTYDKSKEQAAALQAYGRVLELHPNSPQAATALYRSALIEIARKNSSRARSMLNQLTKAYPRSPEATSAKEQLRKLK